MALITTDLLLKKFQRFFTWIASALPPAAARNSASHELKAMLFCDLDQLAIKHPFKNMNVELTLCLLFFVED